MARNVGDLRLLWNVLRGREGVASNAVKGARIAIWDEEPGFPLANEVRAGVGRAASALTEAGAVVGNAKIPVSGAELMQPYLQILTAVLSSGLPDDVYNAFAAMRERDLKSLAEGGAGCGRRRVPACLHGELSRCGARHHRAPETEGCARPFLR